MNFRSVLWLTYLYGPLVFGCSLCGEQAMFSVLEFFADLHLHLEFKCLTWYLNVLLDISKSLKRYSLLIKGGKMKRSIFPIILNTTVWFHQCSFCFISCRNLLFLILTLNFNYLPGQIEESFICHIRPQKGEHFRKICVFTGSSFFQVGSPWALCKMPASNSTDNEKIRILEQTIKENVWKFWEIFLKTLFWYVDFWKFH